METKSGKPCWTQGAEVLMDEAQYPAFSNFHKLDRLLLGVRPAGVPICLRAAPTELLYPLFGEFSSTNATPVCYYAGPRIPENLKWGQRGLKLDAENQNDVEVIEGCNRANQLIRGAMKFMSSELVSFCQQGWEEGEVPFEPIQRKFEDIKLRSDFKMMKSYGKAYLALDDTSASGLSLEDMVDWTIYIRPMLAGEAGIWLNTSACECCGKIFFYERSTAKFCSDACRVKAAYRSRRKK